ncbi:CTNL1 protein, partial [Trogon melanurus]|nr:CTNL1 protein [Trogon melanurus]
TGMLLFQSKVEGLRENLYFLSKENLSTMLEVILEHTEDFTDSAYTSHEHREHILELSKQAKMELEQLVSVWMQAQNQKTKDLLEDLEVAILKTCQCMNELKREVHSAATSLAADLLKYHMDHMVLKALKITGVEGNLEAVAEYTCKLSEQKEQLVEMCRLLRHVSGTEPLEITCIHAEDTFQVTGPQIISAAETLALHPSSKIAKENLEVFCEAWESQLSDMSMLLREINDVFEGRREKRVYLSLPRPKHNANLIFFKPVKLDTEEQAKIAKLGLELHLFFFDMDSETEKWEDQFFLIVQHGQGMSSMAFFLYLFTRGEGLLKTTQDLFFLAESLYHRVVLSFFFHDDDKPLLLLEAVFFISMCKQLQITAKVFFQGKSATFTKVVFFILKTRNVMTLLCLFFPLCYKLLRKVCGFFFPAPPWRDFFLRPGMNAHTPERRAETLGIKSLENHVTNMTFLESK